MMIFTANQLMAHMIGDYIFQSHWMATNKTKSNIAAFLHAATYTIPFMFLTKSLFALAVIFLTHFIIDRFRLARYVNWLKNWPWQLIRRKILAGHEEGGAEIWLVEQKRSPLVTKTGYPDSAPVWLSTWLLFITDNIMHVVINALALQWL